MVIQHMNKYNDSIKFSALSLVTLFLSLALSACSDSGEQRQQRSEVKLSKTQPSFDHPHGAEVSDLVKHKFEHDFAAQCVEREIKASGDDVQNRDRLEKSCMCIAQHLMAGLTAKEAELFLDKHKDTQSLRIRYEAAAYKCLQENAQTKRHQTPIILIPQR